jgi:crotonobetainyl-CoA:carnitine CoA-transferase CaiB-like acyl-CoA transferase
VTEVRPGALSGVLVIDASRILAGPYAAMLLGDLGAEVVKVEAPGRGDDTRRWGPPFTVAGVSAYYLAVNRGKRGVALDLRQEAGRAVLSDLLSRADVLIENFKAETREAFDLGGGATGRRFPRLVHAAISGFGATGVFAARPGYDSVAQAASGLLANVASSVLIAGDPPGRWGNAHASIVPYQLVRASDGAFMLAVGNDPQFRALVAILEAPAWADDPRFATNPARVRHRETLIPMIEERFMRRPAADWLAALAAAGVPAGPVRTVPEALSSPEAVERGMVVDLPNGDQTTRALGPVPKLSKTPARAGSSPPGIGEHTEEVLRELVGYDDARIGALRATGAIA